jgi:2'-5' RNA ligase
LKVSPIDLQSEQIRLSSDHPLVVGLTILSIELQSSAAKVQDDLKRTDPRHIYHPARSLHVTIKPIGLIGIQVEEGDLRAVIRGFRRVASEFESFDLTLKGLDAFPDVVYARVDEGRDQIIELNKKLAESVKGVAAQGRHEGDEMIPHVTLATFTAPDVDGLLAEVRRRESQFIGKMSLDRVKIVKAFLNRYYGDEEARQSAFEELEVVSLQPR